MSAALSSALPRSSCSSNGIPTGHDQRGRFAKGNAGGPGNPFGRHVAALRAALLAGVTAEDIQRVMAALRDQALKGNIAAIRLLLAYTVGKPASAGEPDDVESDECPPPKQTAAPADEVAPTFEPKPAPPASPIANAAPPVPADEPAKQDTPPARQAAEAAPSEDGSHRSAGPLAQSAAGPAAPSPDGAKGPEPSPIGISGATSAGMPDLRTLRRLASLRHASGT
jgi:hypothetical protein